MHKLFGSLAMIMIVAVIALVVSAVPKPQVQPRNCNDCENFSSSELWKHLEPKVNPYKNCSVKGYSKTGRKRQVMIGMLFQTQYEAEKIWNCPDGTKIEMIWVRW